MTSAPDARVAAELARAAGGRRGRHPLRRPDRAVEGAARAGQGGVGLPPPLRPAGPAAPRRRHLELRVHQGARRTSSRTSAWPTAVRITGEVSDASLAAHYGAADVYLSLSAHEGFGVPLVEAMAAGVPVVARGAGAVGQTVADAALVLDAADPSYVAAALHRVCTDDAPACRAHRRPGTRRAAELDGGRRRRHASSRRSPGYCRDERKGGLRDAALRHRRSWAAPRRRCASWPSTSARSTSWEAEVHTTCALDPITWDDELEPGTSESQRGDGAPPSRTRTAASPTSTASTGLLRLAPRQATREQGRRWVDYNGPVSPELVDAVSASDADVVAFTPYLYHPTVATIGRVRAPAVFHPAAHDEPALYLPVFRGTFGRRRRVLLLHARRSARSSSACTPWRSGPRSCSGLGVGDSEGTGRHGRRAAGAGGPALHRERRTGRRAQGVEDARLLLRHLQGASSRPAGAGAGRSRRRRAAAAPRHRGHGRGGRGRQVGHRARRARCRSHPRRSSRSPSW